MARMPLPELGAQLADGVHVGEVAPIFVQHEAGHLVEGSEDPGPELLFGPGFQAPVHQGPEVVGGIPVLPRILAFDELGRGREELAVGPGQMVQARPGEEVRTLGADGVVGPEGVGPHQLPDELVDLPEGHVAGAVIAQSRQRHAAEEHVQNEGPLIAHGQGDESQRPQELRHRRRLVLHHLEDLVDLVGKGRMGDPHSQLRARKARRDRADLDVREGLAEDGVVGPLHLEDLGDGLQEEAGPQRLELVGQRAPVVGEAHHVGHDAVGALLAEAAHESGILSSDAVGRAGEVQRHHGHAEGLEPRRELHGLAGAHDAVGAGDDHGAPGVGWSEDLVDERGGVGGQSAVAEDVQHGAQAQGGQGGLPHAGDGGGLAGRLLLSLHHGPILLTRPGRGRRCPRRPRRIRTPGRCLPPDPRLLRVPR